MLGLSASEDSPIPLWDGAIDITKEYDPMFLRHLRRPRPRSDPDCDVSTFAGNFFTFDDALEDLLTWHFTGQAMPMVEMAVRRFQAHLTYPRGEPIQAMLYRWSLHGHLHARFEKAFVRGPLAGYLTPARFGKHDMNILDPHDVIQNTIQHELMAEAFSRAAAFPGGRYGDALWPPSCHNSAASISFPRHETELAEATAEKSSSSWWPSPFETWRNLLGDGKSDNEGAGHGKSGFRYSSESTSTSIDENGTTEEKVTQYTDEEGRKIKVVFERKLDPEGNVISEKTQRFEDGEEKEKDVYGDL